MRKSLLDTLPCLYRQLAPFSHFSTNDALEKKIVFANILSLSEILPEESPRALKNTDPHLYGGRLN